MEFLFGLCAREEFSEINIRECNYLGIPMMNIAIIAGGPSAERGVSLKSAATIANHLSKEKYNVTTIDLSESGWIDTASQRKVDLNTFSLPEEKGHPLKHFDFAFINQTFQKSQGDWHNYGRGFIEA